MRGGCEQQLLVLPIDPLVFETFSFLWEVVVIYDRQGNSSPISSRIYCLTADQLFLSVFPFSTHIHTHTHTLVWIKPGCEPPESSVEICGEKTQSFLVFFELHLTSHSHSSTDGHEWKTVCPGIILDMFLHCSCWVKKKNMTDKWSFPFPMQRNISETFSSFFCGPSH